MAHDIAESLKLRLSKESSPHYDEGETRPESAREPGSFTSRADRSLELLNEQSPLLSPKQSLDGAVDAVRRGHSSADILEWNKGDGQETKSVWYLILLTLGIGG